MRWKEERCGGWEQVQKDAGGEQVQKDAGGERERGMKQRERERDREGSFGQWNESYTFNLMFYLFECLQLHLTPAPIETFLSRLNRWQHFGTTQIVSFWYILKRLLDKSLAYFNDKSNKYVQWISIQMFPCTTEAVPKVPGLKVWELYSKSPKTFGTASVWFLVYERVVCKFIWKGRDAFWDSSFSWYHHVVLGCYCFWIRIPFQLLWTS